jgi:hypothetical protein
MEKILFLLLSFFSLQVFALDCHEIFTYSKPLSCEAFTSEEALKEKDTVISLLQQKKNHVKKDVTFSKKYTICSDELRAIQGYTRSTYRQYNNLLRNGEESKLSKTEKREICLISKGIRKTPLYKGTVYRGAKLDKRTAEKYLILGNVIKENAFLSTDKNLAKAFDFLKTSDPNIVRIIFKFNKPLGHEIKSLSINPSEDEVLIDRGTSFVVHSIDKKNDGSDYYMVVLQPKTNLKESKAGLDSKNQNDDIPESSGKKEVYSGGRIPKAKIIEETNEENKFKPTSAIQR